MTNSPSPPDPINVRVNGLPRDIIDKVEIERSRRTAKFEFTLSCKHKVVRSVSVNSNALNQHPMPSWCYCVECAKEERDP